MPRRNPLQDEVDYLQNELAVTRVANTQLEREVRRLLAIQRTLVPHAARLDMALLLLNRFLAPHRHGPVHETCWRCDRDSFLGA